MQFELREPPENEVEADDLERYDERCENIYDENGDEMEDGPCGGKLKAIGGHGYFNGSYQCYTMTLECDRCGTYDVECV